MWEVEVEGEGRRKCMDSGTRELHGTVDLWNESERDRERRSEEARKR